MNLVTLDQVDLETLARLADALVREPIAFPVCFAVTGTLGAGKTRWTQEIARAMGLDASEVTSPTFTLLRTYHAPQHTLHHVDAYRVGDEDEWWELGLEECYQEPNAWTVIEWADRFEEAMPSEAIWMHIDFQSESPTEATRDLKFRCDEPERFDWVKRSVSQLSGK
ncbi:tRNA (adenosine(37)-N6)-threonylcarbamoyltransferase complex ATPase subunit type 1 TsaE [Rhodopirellula sp. JC740]|uniref:tRNA threonylcarbamoyladenosine biosynthesis protein TsaE n=1 Tax=Rhodopirellula halodulae TaxID=2894198 RepID=A0ABS8NL34_9BACT|nr:tRNA (adenosine(37)-N6)-threonylcarbamoyltransferase complex ATPase subunit type 1 TsaE [Rhodopirellula sp. JC740]MCC9644268.1 tRNA (adenosine(37)-N6)-threonylcarbamoyltransferase complex ATPase subunit type 1 TsaE [Rhodopirellula sp. JC740]